MGNKNDFVLLEGDEYLSSIIDPQPKFLWYTPEITLISGIAWDHINVFPTFDDYVTQFEIFIYSIKAGGILIYNEEDEVLKKLVESIEHPIKKIGYNSPDHFIDKGQTYLETDEGNLPLMVFGSHNLQNLAGAQWISQLMGLDRSDFFESMPSFKGVSKRLELFSKGKNNFLFKDFAHSPSKVKATSLAFKNQFERKKIIVCLELHSYSSLDSKFIKQYANSLDSVDEALIFYDFEALKIKNKTAIFPMTIEREFDHNSLTVFTEVSKLQTSLLGRNYSNVVMVMMSSGNFGGINWVALGECFI
tara:strand:- start:321 stop:1232 length:912 start_codon:yes stop_codon:yes gene_type:complete